VLDLADALAVGDAPRVLREVDRVSALTPDFGELLRELIGLLHRVALVQQVPQTLAADDPDRARIESLAAALAPEDIQLYYQIALTGQQDLPLAPDPRSGLEMVLLRALAFRPAPTSPHQARPAAPAPAAETRGVSTSTAKQSPPVGQPTRPPRQTPAAPAPGPGDAATLASNADWQRLLAGLRLGGIVSQLAQNCAFVGLDDGRLVLSLDPKAEQLRSASTEDRLRAALETALGAPLRLEIRVIRPESETPAQRRSREAAERQRLAEIGMEQDPVALRLQDELDAQWVPGSIGPVD